MARTGFEAFIDDRGSKSMQGFAGLLIMFGVLTPILNMFNVTFTLVSWVPAVFGSPGEYFFYAGCVVVGIILLVVGSRD